MNPEDNNKEIRDEAFINLNDVKYSVEFCEDLRKELFRKTGIPVSIGIAKTKTLAKLANKISKESDKVFMIDGNNRDKISEEIKISSVWGVGEKMAVQVNSFGVTTVKDFIEKEDFWIRNNFGIVGLRIALELRGKACGEDFNNRSGKSIINSSSFSKNTSDINIIKSSIVNHISNSLKNIRIQNKSVKSFSIFIATSKTSKNRIFLSESVSLEYPTTDNIYITKIVLETLDKIFIPGVNYSKSGVSFYNFYSDKMEPNLDLFEKSVNTRDKLFSSMDILNQKFGKDSISFAIEKNKIWKPKKDLISGSFTINKNEILEVF